MPRPRPTACASAGAEPAAPEALTLPGLFWSRVGQWGDRVALRHKQRGIWRETAWTGYGEQVQACGNGLLALGLAPGERVCILSEDRPEWLWADLGTLCAGGVSVGVYAANSAEQCGYIARHCQARVCFVEDQEQYDKVAQVLPELPCLRWVVVFDPRGLRGVCDPRVLTFAHLLELGRDLARTSPDALPARQAAVRPDDTAILFYTSGTTGPPKGVMHSHRSLIEGFRPMLSVYPVTPQDETLCYMPLCHVMERLNTLVGGLLCGQVVSFAEAPDTVLRDLREVAPTAYGGVPRTWERVKARIEIGRDEAPWVKRQALRLGLAVGRRWWACQRDHRRPSPGLRLLHLAAEWAVLRKVRQRLGLGRVRLAAVGAAPVAAEVIELLRAVGVPLREGYGQTETGFTVVTPEGGVRPGRIGLPLPGVEFRVKASPYIMDAVLVGEGRPFLAALIVLDEETVSHHAQSRGLPFASLADLAAHPDIHRLIEGEVAQVNRRWSDREQIRDFRILRWELSSEDEELTPTLKVRRQFLCERYRALIEDMYPGQGAA
ncbi:MAG: AMP-binding protein [Candidatus Latescibacterota bacterium]